MLTSYMSLYTYSLTTYIQNTQKKKKNQSYPIEHQNLDAKLS